MLEIKDSGPELHISRPRVVGLVFAVAVSPIYLVLDVYHHETLGTVGAIAAYALLTIAYIQRHRLRAWVRRVRGKSPAG